MNRTQEELYREKKKRIDDVISLKQPDRVPIWFQGASFFPPRYGGVTAREAMDDADPELVKVWFEVTRTYGVYV